MTKLSVADLGSQHPARKCNCEVLAVKELVIGSRGCKRKRAEPEDKGKAGQNHLFFAS